MRGVAAAANSRTGGTVDDDESTFGGRHATLPKWKLVKSLGCARRSRDAMFFQAFRISV
jgi:hypothetical protein